MNPFNFAPIYLASQSPRRAQLLTLIGVPFEVFLPHDAAAAEALEIELPNESPHDYVQRVVMLKAQYAAQSIARQGLPSRAILCADTTVAVDKQILGKPMDANDIARILRLLSGRSHQVHTAVAIVHNDKHQYICVTSDVTFKTLTEHEIAAYIISGEPYGKAGAYAIQGLGAAFVAHLSGSHSAVMGLPVHEVANALRIFKGN